MAGTDPFAQCLGLWVEAGGCRDAVAEQFMNDDVDRKQVGQRIDLDVERSGFGEQLFERLLRQQSFEPGVCGLALRVVCGDPNADVRVAALVAAARIRDVSQGLAYGVRLLSKWHSAEGRSLAGFRVRYAPFCATRARICAARGDRGRVYVNP